MKSFSCFIVVLAVLRLVASFQSRTPRLQLRFKTDSNLGSKGSSRIFTMTPNSIKEEELTSLTVRTLREMLRSKGMPVSGVKADLVARLMGSNIQARRPIRQTGAAQNDKVENPDTMPETNVRIIPPSEALTDSPALISAGKEIVEKPQPKIPKVELIKIRSNYLFDPLQEEMTDDRIFVGPDAVVVLKYHGSYQQDNRDQRVRGEEKKYSFMLRLKSPFGEIPPNLYKELDNMCDEYGQNDLRATTRQAFQLHGILKGDLKTVINRIMACGSSTVGACGDVSRNVMCPPAPKVDPEYRYARLYSQVLAELFKPQSPAFSQIWETPEIPGEGLSDMENRGQKVAEMEYWQKPLQEAGLDPAKEMLKDSGTGIITDDPAEPLYGNQYLPRKFKTAVTVPGDNSLDIYTNDIGLIVITNPQDPEELLGFNVVVGGGMGRTHKKDTTFARTADHLGFVAKDDVMELCKAILATQRDHGNRDVRPNARMKYLVYEKGIEKFRELVQGYFGKKIEKWRDLPEWKYYDWMGWHEQGDGNLFLGINVEQGRVRNKMGTNGDVHYKTAIRDIVDKYDLTMILTPSQSVVFKDIKPADKDGINAILKRNNVPQAEDIDDLILQSMACPALPMCGLAVAEAERRMPTFNEMVREVLKEIGMPNESLRIRMTGCPNGCARPYMAELALVGDGPDMYQIWVGGSPGLTRLAEALDDRVKWIDMKAYITALLKQWRDFRKDGEAFGDFANRVGLPSLRLGQIDAEKVDQDTIWSI